MASPYQVLTTPSFERDFKNLDTPIARRVSKKVVRLAVHPELLGKPLKNLPNDLAGLHKCRIGDYRLLYWVDHERRVLKLYAVGHRSSVYRGL